MPDIVVVPGAIALGFVLLILMDRARRANKGGIPAGKPSGPSDREVRFAGWLVGLFALGMIAVWYFGVYDTATGRCNRGDLGACIVAAEQRNP